MFLKPRELGIYIFIGFPRPCYWLLQHCLSIQIYFQFREKKLKTMFEMERKIRHSGLYYLSEISLHYQSSLCISNIVLISHKISLKVIINANKAQTHTHNPRTSDSLYSITNVFKIHT